MDEASDAGGPPAAAEMTPERLGLGTLAELVRASMDGIAVRLHQSVRQSYSRPRRRAARRPDGPVPHHLAARPDDTRLGDVR